MIEEIVVVDEIPQEIVDMVNGMVGKYNKQVNESEIKIRRLACSSEHVMTNGISTLFFVYESGKFNEDLEDYLTTIDLRIAREFGRADINVQSFAFGTVQALREEFLFLHNYDKD